MTTYVRPYHHASSTLLGRENASTTLPFHVLGSVPAYHNTAHVWHWKLYLAFEDRGRAEGAHPQEVLRQDAHHVRSQRAHEVLDLHGVVPAKRDPGGRGALQDRLTLD